MTATIPSPDDVLELLDEDASAAVPGMADAWTVLVVDDDAEVHQATEFALRDAIVCGRRIALLHATSAAEARARIAGDDDIAVILLDVVMESPDAGLALVHTIRETLGRSEVRIVLRTGQPGYAPEMKVIREYDINDYRTKAELTHTRLLTTLTAAIRAYEQIRRLSVGMRGMREIALSGVQGEIPRSVAEFASVALGRIESLVGRPIQAAFCGPTGDGGTLEDRLGILAGRGSYSCEEGALLSELRDAAWVESIRRARAQQASVFGDRTMCLFLGSRYGKEACVLVDLDRPADEMLRHLVGVLAAHLRVAFENVLLLERLNFFAYFDQLTRLPNRTCFLDRLDAALARLDGGGWVLGIIDIVRFSELNNALGHRSGDALLVDVTRRLGHRLGPEAFLSRLAGDAFGVCWRTGHEEASAVLDVFATPFGVRGHAVPMRARAGFVDVVPVAGGAVELLKRANLALAQAKQQGDQHCSFYASEMEERTQSRVQLLNELRSALHLGQGLELFYQPQVRLGDKMAVGCEALIRWFKPDGEMVSPDVFIPLAEYTGLIVEIGDWVLAEACRQLVRWDAEGLPPIRVGINISAAQFREPDFVSKVLAQIHETGIDPSRLELEITESVAVDDPESVARQLKELKALGFSVAVDDFGCGFSSLGSLNRLPFDRVKIDRAFVRELTPSTAEGCIARMIVKLAESLGLKVTAEGVETESQAELLESMGCEEMQGFLYGCPMPAPTFQGWMKSRFGTLFAER